MNNNPLISIMQAMRMGRNPNQMLMQMAQQDPRIKQVVEMMNGKNPAQLRQIAENMAKERGLTIDDVARQLGIQIPSNR